MLANFTRRNVVAGLALTAVASSHAAPANAQNGKRFGTLGIVKPTIVAGPIEDLIPFLPAGMAYAPVYLKFQNYSTDEFADILPSYEQNIALLADQKCDLISAEAAPPFLLLGPQREAEVIHSWEAKYRVPIFTSSQNQVNAMRALKIKRFVGMSQFTADQNRLFGKYFTDAGFTVLSMDSLPVSVSKTHDVPAAEIAAFIRANVAKQSGVDAVYILGSGWSALDIIGSLEKDLGIPVIYPVLARAWEIQKRLHLHYPLTGYGRLLAELP